MFGFSISIKDGASPEIARLFEKLNETDLAVAGAESLADLLRRKLKQLEDTRPNKMGWPRQHFWADAYKRVQNPTRLTGGGAKVSIPQVGLAQRIFGGNIRPIGHPFLAIPAREEAYGKNPRDFNNLVVVMTGPDRGMLIESASQRLLLGRKKKDGTRSVKGGEESGGGVMFWLRREVHQDADPSVLPTQDEMQAAVVAGATTRANRILGGEE